MVLEYRLDPLRQQISIIANERSRRPLVLHGEKVTCPFDVGVESLTPPTKLALPKARNWRVRAFDNAFAFLKRRGKYNSPRAPLPTFWTSPAFGSHEVIVESNEHGKLFQDFSTEQLMLVLQAYKQRFKALEADKNAKYVYLFKNHGIKAGASIDHEHAQIVSLPFVPELARREAQAGARLAQCMLCKLLEKEKGNILSSNHSFTALCPSFSRFAFETWLIPQREVRNIAELNKSESYDFMHLLRQVIARVYSVSKDYNVVFHNAPKGEAGHFHAEVLPRTSIWAGMELGTGIIVNTKSEKEALTALRAARV